MFFIQDVFQPSDFHLILFPPFPYLSSNSLFQPLYQYFLVDSSFIIIILKHYIAVFNSWVFINVSHFHMLILMDFEIYTGHY